MTSKERAENLWRAFHGDYASMANPATSEKFLKLAEDAILEAEREALERAEREVCVGCKWTVRSLKPDTGKDGEG